MADTLGEHPHNKGAIELRVWQARTMTSNATLAKQVGKSVVTISMLRRGDRKPGRSLALEIEKATAGTVSASAWDQPGDGGPTRASSPGTESAPMPTAPSVATNDAHEAA